MKGISRKDVVFPFLGIILFLIIASIPVLIFCEDRRLGELGLIFGTIVGCFMQLHTIIVTKTSVRQAKSGKSIGARMVLASIFRLMFMGTFLLIIGYFRLLNLITSVVGVVGARVGLYVYLYFSNS